MMALAAEIKKEFVTLAEGSVVKNSLLISPTLTFFSMAEAAHSGLTGSIR